MDTPKSYYAFISYKREDKKEAKRLQHSLEYYKLPNKLRQENAELPEYVRPIFRDMTDLEVGELSKQIHEALEQSHYLIVICSPRAAQSKWVNDEIDYFISLGKQDKIIPYIIEGIPHAANSDEECYPPALLTLSKEKELLGANINEVGKESAAIRVVSRMFNIRFDTLYQRYQREVRKRNLMIILSAITFVVLIIGVAWTLRHQNVALTRTNWQLMESKNRYLHDKIKDLIADGDCYMACRLALDILPQDISIPDKPYSKDIEADLRMALADNNAKIISDWAGISTFSPDGTMIVENGAYEASVIWDARNGSLVNILGRYYHGDENSDRASSIIFSKDSKYILTIHQPGDCSIWEIETGEEIFTYNSYDEIPEAILDLYSDVYRTEESGYFGGRPDTILSPQRTKYLLTGDTMRIVNIQSDNLLRSFTAKGVNRLKWSTDTNIIGYDNDGCYEWNYYTGEQIRCIHNAIDLTHTNDNRYLALYCGQHQDLEIIDVETHKVISKLRMEQLEPFESITACYFTPDGKQVVVELEYFYAAFFDVYSGNLICQFDVPSEGSFIGVISGNGKYYFTTGAGGPNSIFELSSYSLVKNMGYEFGSPIAFSDDGSMAAVCYDKNNVVIKFVSSDDYIHLSSALLVDSVVSMSFSNNNQLLVTTHNDGSIIVWDTNSGTMMTLLKGHAVRAVSAIFSSSDQEIISSDEDGIIKVWEYMPIQDLIDNARKRFEGNPLTPEERRQYYLE